MFQKLKQFFAPKDQRTNRPATDLPLVQPKAAPSPEPVGKGSQLRVAFSSAKRSWEEEIDLVTRLMEVLSEHGVETVRESNTLTCSKTGLAFTPEIASFQPLENGAGTNAATIITVTHPEAILNPIFEWQHSSASTMQEGIAQGFDQWCRLDLPVLQDALREKLETCTSLQFDFPDRVLARRVVLGGIMGAGGRPRDLTPTTKVADDRDHEDSAHEFCPCCLFTKNSDAFQELLTGTGLHAIRIFAMRDAQGQVNADCRVNGEDFPAGKASLIEYAKTWPDYGFEFRKQYVLIQDFPKPSKESGDTTVPELP
jgi:hypothetical protein